MPFEDVERDLKDADEFLKTGLTALRQANYQESRRILKQALSLLERCYDKQHPDVATCLKGLADSLYALDEYSEAALIYTRLSMIEANLSPQERVSILFKLAKSYDKAKRFSEAVTTYRQAVAMGEQALPSGHPLTLSCMEGFAQMLRRGGRIPEEAQKLEDRIKQLRMHYRDPGRITRDRLKALQVTSQQTGAEGGATNSPQQAAATPGGPAASPSAAQAPAGTSDNGGKVGQMHDSIKNKARATLTRLEALEAIDSVTDYETLMPSVSPAVQNPVAKTTLNRLAALEAQGALLTPPKPSKSGEESGEEEQYDLSEIEKKRQEALGIKTDEQHAQPQSPEELKAHIQHLRDTSTSGFGRDSALSIMLVALAVVVIGGGYWWFSHVLSRSPNDDMTPTMVAALKAAEQHTSPAQTHQASSEHQPVPGPRVVEDKDLVNLPLANPDDTQIAQVMQIMAKAVEKYYATHKRYPEDSGELEILDSRLSYTNPATLQTDVPELRVVSVANEKAVPGAISFLEIGGSWTGCPWPDHGKVQGCLLHPRNLGGDPADSHIMCIRGVGKDGQFVTMDGGDVLLIKLDDGKITRMGASKPADSAAASENNAVKDFTSGLK